MNTTRKQILRVDYLKYFTTNKVKQDVPDCLPVGKTFSQTFSLIIFCKKAGRDVLLYYFFCTQKIKVAKNRDPVS